MRLCLVRICLPNIERMGTVAPGAARVNDWRTMEDGGGGGRRIGDAEPQGWWWTVMVDSHGGGGVGGGDGPAASVHSTPPPTSRCASSVTSPASPVLLASCQGAYLTLSLLPCLFGDREKQILALLIPPSVLPSHELALMTALPSAPVIEVSHLPSAASFYAAVTQSLGLRYLSSSASPSPSPSPTTRLLFGTLDPTTSRPITVFALQQASLSTPPRQSLITLAAPSPAAVDTFYKKALLANNAQRDHEFERSSDEEARARIEDLDGNMLEAVYSSRAGRHIPTLETASTEKEARRVLAWQEEVARSTVASDVRSSAAGSGYGERRPPPPAYRRADTYPALEHERPMRLVTRDVVTTERYRDERDQGVVEARGGGGGGFTGMRAVGMLLGAAAGAAVAYAMVRSDSPPRLAPPPRRASYGDYAPQYTHARPVEMSRAVERIPARSYVSARDPPRYLQDRLAPPPAPSRALAQDIARIEERSHVSHRSARESERGSRARSRSEVGSSRHSHALTDLPPRARSPSPHSSHVSRRSHKSDSHHSKRDTDRESYVSARSQRTESTAKPVQYVTASPSKVTTTTIRMVPPRDERRSEVSYARHIPLPRSEVSARHVPLPRSVVSGRGYASSVAPSDSVSSIGSKRERERLRERMSERERW